MSHIYNQTSRRSCTHSSTTRLRTLTSSCRKCRYALSLPPPPSFSNSLSLTHTRTHTHTHTHTQTNTYSLTPHTHTFHNLFKDTSKFVQEMRSTHTHTYTRACALSLSLSLFLFLFFSLSLSHTYTHSLSLCICSIYLMYADLIKFHVVWCYLLLCVIHCAWWVVFCCYARWADVCT